MIQKKRIGKQKAVKSPLQLMELFVAYRTTIKKNPLIVIDWVGGMAKRVRRPKERPLTMEGFENYCNEQKVIADLKNYFANTNGSYGDFTEVCSKIKNAIRQDQIEGGMCGIYNASITQRICGLTEKVEQTHMEQPLFNERPISK